MKTLLAILLCAVLGGCRGYDTITDMYVGATDEGDLSGGARIGSYLVGDSKIDGGVAIDASGMDGGEDVVRMSATPLFLLRWRATEYLQPYAAIGPSAVFTDWKEDDSWDAGADLRLGVSYRVGDIAAKPWWVFLELRGLYADVEIDEVTGAASLFAPAQKRGRGTPCFPDDIREECETSTTTTTTTTTTNTTTVIRSITDTLPVIDEWGFMISFGTSIRW